MRVHPWRGASVSQIQTFRSSPRKWWFQKIAKLPEIQKDSFTYGNALHACLARYLEKKDNLFPSGWNEGLTIEQSMHIQAQVQLAIDRGLVDLSPDTIAVERKFQLEVDPRLPTLYGVIDWAKRTGVVSDHKSVASRKWAKTTHDLQTDLQLRTYATVLGGLWLSAEERPEVFKGRHINFSKHQVDDVWATEEVIYTQESLEENFVGLRESMFQMLAVSKATDWQEIPCPPHCCTDYGGCPFRGICEQTQSVNDYVASVYEAQKFQQALTPTASQSSNPTQPMGNSVLDRLSALKAPQGSAPAPTPAPPQQAAPPPPAQPPQQASQEPAPATSPGGPAPWADPACVACKGSGWQSKHPVPCRICALSAATRGAPLPGQFRVEVSAAGVPTAVPIEGDGINGSLPAAAPAPQPEPPSQEAPMSGTATRVKSSNPLQTLRQAAAKQTGPAVVASAPAPAPQPEPDPEPQQPAEAEVMPEEAQVDPDVSYVLCIGCAAFVKHSSAFRFRATLSLTELVFYGQLGREIAKNFKVTEYANAPALKRKDLLLAVGPTWIAENCQGCLITALDSNPEIRELAELLSVRADLTFRSIR